MWLINRFYNLGNYFTIKALELLIKYTKTTKPSHLEQFALQGIFLAQSEGTIQMPTRTASDIP